MWKKILTISLVLVMVLVLVACAAPTPTPTPMTTPTPTPSDTEGERVTPSETEIVYFEDFEGEIQNWVLETGWQFKRVRENTVLKGEGHRWATLENKGWDNYVFKARFALAQGAIHFNYRLSESPTHSRYFIQVTINGINLQKQHGNEFYELTDISLEIDDEWHEIEIIGYEDIVNIRLDSKLYIVYRDESPILSGGIAFETLEESMCLIDDVEISISSPEMVQTTEEVIVRIHNESRGGTLIFDEIWSGEIRVTEDIIVPEGVTLTIEPGTVVKFKYYRGYKEPGKRSNLLVKGGTIRAIGTPEKQIWFTSDADDPINGDWEGISLVNTKDSEFNYVIVEFGELGIEQFDSEVIVSNSIIRWNNSEGLYAERSTPVFINNTLYGNAYHEIALEQYNENVQILYNVIRDGHFGVHCEKTTAYLEGNYFKNEEGFAITAGMESHIVVKGNKFENIGNEPPIHVYDGATAQIENNDYGEGNIPIPEFDYEDIRDYELDYIPGDPEDRFLYIYDEVDETRRTVRKIGQGLEFGFALAYAENSLWRFSLGEGEIGESLDFIKIDPITGAYQKYGNNEIMAPSSKRINV
jgi:hypothetical protein